MSLSLTRAAYFDQSTLWNKEASVAMLNPLSSDLDVLRQTLLFSGLEAISYNQNRKRADLKLYEFGKTYHRSQNKESGETFYNEKNHLALFMCGKSTAESWIRPTESLSFYHIKAAVNQVLQRLGINSVKEIVYNDELFSTGMKIEVKQKVLVEVGIVSKTLLKKMDIKTAVFYADFDWDAVLKLAANNQINFTELPKYPEVRRDLALLIDSQVSYNQLKELAFQTEKKILKEVKKIQEKNKKK